MDKEKESVITLFEKASIGVGAVCNVVERKAVKFIKSIQREYDCIYQEYVLNKEKEEHKNSSF